MTKKKKLPKIHTCIKKMLNFMLISNAGFK